ncbi:Dps family protein [Gandjariella thermophila]|uniref:DNA starvation/stationary phase protection protein n=1 Tax=Gandjariella thermophila TaxID=1931992 RepID=A0A4D4J8D8_9PSEU|nr:DNA starvation/stationary phase protection protein [Gandjariella thermophila]GDY30699.1 DNA starvation/stationary phase protection protein [Gandjariella thermophila]
MSHPITTALGPGERDATGGVLQGALVDLIDLTLIAKQAHWNVVGTHFRSVHLQLDELVSAARTYTDQVAERAAAIGCSPDGRAKTVVDQSGLPEFPSDWQKDNDVIRAIVDSLEVVVRRMRQRIEETDKTDLVTQDLLLDLTAKLEEAHWMWQAQLA